MSWKIDAAFETSSNHGVLAFLRAHSPSAHSDVADELILAARDAPGASCYCPDAARYAFVAVHRPDHTIVALALGMSRIVLRLPESLVAEALRDGGSPFREIGPEWVAFSAFTNDLSLADSRRRLGRWCRRALALGPEEQAG